MVALCSTAPPESPCYQCQSWLGKAPILVTLELAVVCAASRTTAAFFSLCNGSNEGSSFVDPLNLTAWGMPAHAAAILGKLVYFLLRRSSETLQRFPVVSSSLEED